MRKSLDEIIVQTPGQSGSSEQSVQHGRSQSHEVHQRERSEMLHALRDMAAIGRQSLSRQPSPVRQRTPTQAIIDFDGSTRLVRAHQVRSCSPTSGLLTFVAHTLMLAMILVTSLVMVIRTNGTNSTWMGLLGLSVGGVFPNPKYKDKSNAATQPGQPERVPGILT